LESRLDNVVFKMGFSVSRRQSRQLVNHGHVKVNGVKVDKVSYLVKPGDVIEFKDKSKKIVPVEEAIEISKNISTPAWLEVNFDEVKGTFLRNPERDEVEIPVDIQSIIELYSK
jgi:small subunit ribosomal protein S4